MTAAYAVKVLWYVKRHCTRTMHIELSIPSIPLLNNNWTKSRGGILSKVPTFHGHCAANESNLSAAAAAERTTDRRTSQNHVETYRWEPALDSSGAPFIITNYYKRIFLYSVLQCGRIVAGTPDGRTTGPPYLLHLIARDTLKTRKRVCAQTRRYLYTYACVCVSGTCKRKLSPVPSRTHPRVRTINGA